LVDFIVIDMVRTLVSSAVERFHQHFSASFHEASVSVRDLNDVLGDAPEFVCSPMFRMAIVLKRGMSLYFRYIIMKKV